MMKSNLLSVLLAGIMVLSQGACAVNTSYDTSASSEQFYQADDKHETTETVTEIQKLPSEPGYRAFSSYLKGAGRTEKGYDGDAFIHSEAANQIYQDLYYYATYGLSQQDDPAIYEYWESLGLQKKIYDADDADRMWSVFVPTTFEESYQYPVVFCLHGNNNNILLTETYGFAKLGGTEGFITVVPWAKNEDIIVDEIPRILDVLRSENYPIDERKIYATGFSKGGMATQTVALQYSDIFAAAAPGGCSPLGISDNAAPITSGSLNWSFRSDAFVNAHTIPMLFFGGSCDSMPINTTAVNAWIELSGANAPEMNETWFADGISNTANETETYTGLRYQSQRQTEIRRYDGQNYYIGRYFNNEGICTFETVSVEGAPHWVMPSEPRVVWEFLSQFSRDTETHELRYTETDKASQNNEYTLSDVRNLQDFLLAKPTDEDLTGKDYDLDHDGAWTVFDLCLMKRAYISNHPVRDYVTEITFDYTSGTTHASNQTAIWIEDSEGNIVKNLYVSNFTASRRGYRQRENALSHWGSVADPEAMTDEEIDAVSSATFRTGAQSVTWDFTDDNGHIVADGIYTIKVEGTLYWSSNILYSAEIDLSDLTESELEVAAIRSEPETAENADMIENVRISIIPKTLEE